METPLLTSAAACFRFCSVIKLIVPSTSSLPQRPQFVFCLKSRSKSAADILVGAELLCWAFAVGLKRPKLRANTLPPAAATTSSLDFIVLLCFFRRSPYQRTCP